MAYLMKRVQSGGNQIIITAHKMTSAIKYRMNFFCGDLPKSGGSGMPQ